MQASSLLFVYFVPRLVLSGSLPVLVCFSNEMNFEYPLGVLSIVFFSPTNWLTLVHGNRLRAFEPVVFHPPLAAIFHSLRSYYYSGNDQAVSRLLVFCIGLYNFHAKYFQVIWAMPLFGGRRSCLSISVSGEGAPLFELCF